MILYDTLPHVDGASLAYTAEATNISGPAAVDGTGLQAVILNDPWGFHQAVLKATSIVPSGTVEDADTSQILDGLKNMLSPVGTVIQGFWNADPSTLDYRVLPLEGQGILVANYVELTASVYVGDLDNPTAEAFYRSTDSGGTSRSTTGAYLQLPDTRGSFLRDNDSGMTYDPYGDRTMGETQHFYIQKHSHYVGEDHGGGVDALVYLGASVLNGTGDLGGLKATGVGLIANTEAFAVQLRATNVDGETVNKEATEAAPRNTICRFAIRY